HHGGRYGGRRHRALHRLLPRPGSAAMIGESIYAVGVAWLRPPGAEMPTGAAREPRGAVLYCDICRRWGAAGTTHICWRNWRVRLSDLLLDRPRDGRSR